MTKPTPGPWVKGRYDDLIGSNGKRVEVRNLGVSHLMCGRETEEEDEADLNDRLMQNAWSMREALMFVCDCIPRPPAANCSCHVNPPCSDCVDHGAEREMWEYIDAVMAKVRDKE